MINKIIEFSAQNRFVVFLFVGIATFIGYSSMKNVPLDALPDLSDTQVIVIRGGIAVPTSWRIR